MPAELESIRKGIKRENPGMAKSRTYSIATAAFKKKHGIRGKTTEEEMAEKAKTAGPILRYGIEKMKETVKGKKKSSIIRDKLAAQSSVSFPELLKGLKTTKTLKTSEKEDTDPSTESSGVKADEEMETLPKQSALQKFAKAAKWESQPTFAARHPGWTTAGGALLGNIAGGLPGQIASFAGTRPEVAMPIAAAGGLAGAVGGGYLGYRHAKKRQQQYLKGSPEGKTIMKKKQAAFQDAFFDELSKIAQGVSVGQYIKGGLQKAVKAIPKPKLPTSIPKPKLPGISGGLKPINF